MIAIKTADLTQDFKRVADRVIQGETVLISRPRNENLVIITEKEYNEFEELRKRSRNIKIAEAFRALQEEAVSNGADKMTLDEINEEIAAYRREKREKQCEK
jgi:antitoxin YefM